jgi:hypothetical protein
MCGSTHLVLGTRKETQYTQQTEWSDKKSAGLKHYQNQEGKGQERLKTLTLT